MMGLTVGSGSGRVHIHPRWGAARVAASHFTDHGAVRELRHASQ
jgi:hypothetical protein